MSTTEQFDLGGLVERVVPEVFRTMLSMEVEKSGREGERGECVSGTIGIEGDGLSGAVYLHFTAALARKAAAAMVGFAETEVDALMENDVTSELTNMIGGGIKSALCDAGQACAMSTPSIVRGPAFAVELPPGTQCEKFVFESRGETLAVEIHLKRE